MRQIYGMESWLNDEQCGAHKWAQLRGAPSHSLNYYTEVLYRANLQNLSLPVNFITTTAPAAILLCRDCKQKNVQDRLCLHIIGAH